jgi:LuxR family maltose regulon positive regulatory protein
MFHLVIATRRDPPLDLIKLRAENRINEIRLLDLRFNRSETREFMTLATGLAIENPVVDKLQKEVEGWAVGIQLAALAARHGSNPQEIELNLTGNSPVTREYLVREVLRAQPPELKNGLLVSSIFDRFCAPLIEAVLADCFAQSNRAISASKFLASVLRESLFLIPLDSEGEWFRFHHLFREMLNDELVRIVGRAQVRSLHRKASEWFEAEDLIAEALEHALASGDNQHAAQIISERVHRLISEGHWNLLEEWLDLLPPDSRQADPLLQLGEAFIHYRNINVSAIPPLMDRIDELTGDEDKEHELCGETAVFRAYCALMNNDSSSALNILESNDCITTIPPNHPTLALTEILYGLAGQIAGQGDRVRSKLKLLLCDDSSCLEPMRETSLAQTQVMLSYIDADSKGIGPLLRHSRNVAEPANLQNLIPWTEYMDGLFNLQKGHLRDAIPLLEKAVEGRYFHHVLGAINGMIALAVCYQCLGLSKEAVNTLRSLERFVIGHQPPLDVFVDSCATRLSLLRGEGADAQYWIENTEPAQKEMMFFWFEVPGITRCRALIETGADKDLNEAATVLEAYVKECEAQHNKCHLIEVLALLALTYERQGNTEQSRIALNRALTLARDGRFVFAFLEPGQGMLDLLERAGGENEEFARYIISVFSNLVAPVPSVEIIGHQQKGPEVAEIHMSRDMLVEPLTSREQDVLGLLVKRLQDKEIAIELGIAPSTVKGHLKHIFDKLQIHDRRHAARQAARYGYLA